jgi:hypothetical protein
MSMTPQQIQAAITANQLASVGKGPASAVTSIATLQAMMAAQTGAHTLQTLGTMLEPAPSSPAGPVSMLAATVLSVQGSGATLTMTVLLQGADVPGVAPLAGYVPTVGDYTWILEQGGSLFAIGPVGVPQTLTRAGSTVVTFNSGGDGTITFPTAFPTACDSFVLCNGDATVSVQLVMSAVTLPTTTSVNVHCVSSSTAAPFSGNARVNWIAVGH